ncbi:hypothetical protein C5B94_14020 [Clavibacter michiganensis]|uniref:hypothetical protein n=1 Tax=Clavibacter michiganensis TaxID=28447 RepID=UPI000CE7D706|nr:hypothetical protein [Clavibacter michiganensis]PPF51769.1 hypothetical protein C5B94_14020 [Clavibacter michiganensis]
MTALMSRRTVGAVQIVGAAALCSTTAASLRETVTHGVSRDHFNAFGNAMLTPWLILLPLAIVVTTCTRFSSDLSHRFISAQRLRRPVRSLILTRLVQAAAVGFGLAFLMSFVTYLLAFHALPLIGDPGIDPAGYLMDAAEAAEYSRQETGFGAVLRLGDAPFGLVFSAWTGFCGAVYAVMGITALLFIRNRLVALAAPMLLVFGETFAAAIAGIPRLALYYSESAYGLSYDSDLEMMLPTLVLALVVSVIAAVAIRRAPHSSRLS